MHQTWIGICGRGVHSGRSIKSHLAHRRSLWARDRSATPSSGARATQVGRWLDPPAARQRRSAGDSDYFFIFCLLSIDDCRLAVIDRQLYRIGFGRFFIFPIFWILSITHIVLLINPVMVAWIERSFSKLKLWKSHICTTMAQQSINNLATI
jgi:hypothetical protein